jgi:hypothetical protein
LLGWEPGTFAFAFAFAFVFDLPAFVFVFVFTFVFTFPGILPDQHTSGQPQSRIFLTIQGLIVNCI